MLIINSWFYYYLLGGTRFIRFFWFSTIFWRCKFAKYHNILQSLWYWLTRYCGICLEYMVFSLHIKNVQIHWCINESVRDLKRLSSIWRMRLIAGGWNKPKRGPYHAPNYYSQRDLANSFSSQYDFNLHLYISNF